MFLLLAQTSDLQTLTAVPSTEGTAVLASETVAEVEQHQKDLCLTRQSDEAGLKH